MTKPLIHILLSMMVLFIATLPQLKMCCCVDILPSQYMPCHDESTDSEHAVSTLKCQCDQQTSNTLATISNSTGLLTLQSFRLVSSLPNTLHSQINNTIYRPPIFI